MSLSHSSSEPCAVSWSEDQRIAVTTNEVVYVLVKNLSLSLSLPHPHNLFLYHSQTLRVSLSVVNTRDSPSSADNEKRLPLFITSTVPAPVKSQLSALELGHVQYTPLKSFPLAGNWPFMEIIDPALQPRDTAAVTLPSCDLFKSSDWTPPGCSALGGYGNYTTNQVIFQRGKMACPVVNYPDLCTFRCLLSCLTRSGRLLLYAPPGLLGNQWRLVMGKGKF